jgi:hypothetical protein
MTDMTNRAPARGTEATSPPTEGPECQRAKNEAAIQVLNEWLADESGYDETVWPIAKQAIETNRLSARPRFHD